jgi:diguanylate cyclase (GGDEF)-like protein
MGHLPLDALRAVAEPLAVLVVDADGRSRAATHTMVAGMGHACAVLADGLEAWEAHRTRKVDVVLSDWKIPGLDGLQLCRRIRQGDVDRSYTRFILASGPDERERFRSGLEAGVDDYITKPIVHDELAARLEAARRVVLLHRRLRDRYSALRRDSDRSFAAARTDVLTSMPNRRALDETLTALAEREARLGQRYSAALLDVDEFKSYNDHFGHLAGDEVLRRIAAALHTQLRQDDALYRYGGEEFLVILPKQSLAQAATAMARARAAIERLAIPHASGAGRPFVTVSIGVAELDPDASSVDGWVRRADLALYAAKAGGRNRIELEPRLGRR